MALGDTGLCARRGHPADRDRAGARLARRGIPPALRAAGERRPQLLQLRAEPGPALRRPLRWLTAAGRRAQRRGRRDGCKQRRGQRRRCSAGADLRPGRCARSERSRQLVLRARSERCARRPSSDAGLEPAGGRQCAHPTRTVQARPGSWDWRWGGAGISTLSARRRVRQRAARRCRWLPSVDPAGAPRWQGTGARRLPPARNHHVLHRPFTVRDRTGQVLAGRRGDRDDRARRAEGVLLSARDAIRPRRLCSRALLVAPLRRCAASAAGAASRAACLAGAWQHGSRPRAACI